MSGMVDGVTLKLRAEPRAPAVARRALGRLGLDGTTLDTVQLLVSELVTNSYRHGKLEPPEDIELTVRSHPDRVHVEVADHGVGFDRRMRRHDPGPSPRENGWGLRIVERLADRWGVRNTGGTTVWFDLKKTG